MPALAVYACQIFARTPMVVGCCALAVVGCGADPQSSVEPTPVELETMEAEVLTVQRRPWPTIVRSQGSLFADEVAVVGTEVAGRVAQVHVDLGDFVAENAPLVTLDQDEFRLQVAQAEAQHEQTRSAVGLLHGDPVEKLDPQNAPPVRQERALWNESKSSLQRAANLLQQNAMSQGEYDLAAAAERVAEARYASALNSVREKIALIGVREAELSLARQRLEDAVIRAPMDGYVRQRHVAPGTYLAVGEPIADLVRTNPLRFRGTVSERHAQALSIGQEVRLKIESVAEPRVAHVTRVSPTLDAQSRSLTFEAEIENPDLRLRTGLFVEAEIVIDPDAVALVVPHSAVTEFAGAEKVWKVVDGVAREQEVLSSVRRQYERQIAQGLAEGDVILLNAAQGRMVQIQPIPSPVETHPAAVPTALESPLQQALQALDASASRG